LLPVIVKVIANMPIKWHDYMYSRDDALVGLLIQARAHWLRLMTSQKKGVAMREWQARLLHHLPARNHMSTVTDAHA
jgi:hypothetical protein